MFAVTGVVDLDVIPILFFMYMSINIAGDTCMLQAIIIHLLPYKILTLWSKTQMIGFN